MSEFFWFHLAFLIGQLLFLRLFIKTNNTIGKYWALACIVMETTFILSEIL